MKILEEVENHAMAENKGKEESRKKKSKYSKTKFLIAFAVVAGIFAAVRHAFAIEIPMETGVAKQPTALMDAQAMAEQATDETASANETIAINDFEQEEEDIEYSEVPDSVLFASSHHETVVNSPEDNFVIEPSSIDDTCKDDATHRIRGVWSYAECFPDIQDVQIVAAQQHGITPVRNRKEAEVLVKQHKLVNICHSPFYTVDDLTHSIPYLVPRAQHLLNTICLNFIDSCQVKGLPLHLPIVTSVLRTTDDVSNLQKGNKNATTNSCHCYGTTVDIAYNRFMPMTGTYCSDAAMLRWNEPMKQVLSEVLNDLRRQKKCYVKYERKQGCFHLTCR